jgi:hypothetical protein
MENKPHQCFFWNLQCHFHLGSTYHQMEGRWSPVQWMCDEQGFAYYARGDIHPSTDHFPQTWIVTIDLGYLFRESTCRLPIMAMEKCSSTWTILMFRPIRTYKKDHCQTYNQWICLERPMYTRGYEMTRWTGLGRYGPYPPMTTIGACDLKRRRWNGKKIFTWIRCRLGKKTLCRQRCPSIYMKHEQTTPSSLRPNRLFRGMDTRSIRERKDSFLFFCQLNVTSVAVWEEWSPIEKAEDDCVSRNCFRRNMYLWMNQGDVGLTRTVQSYKVAAEIILTTIWTTVVERNFIKWSASSRISTSTLRWYHLPSQTENPLRYSWLKSSSCPEYVLWSMSLCLG